MEAATVDLLTAVVIAAFEDASKLVVRIRDQRKDTPRSLPDESTRDLLDSLALGPVIVRGHFDHDFKRWGESYGCGGQISIRLLIQSSNCILDIQARENMKDVLIHLQMTLIIALRSSSMDDVDLDFDALQTASDDCRVNAGVCLGQLSQRLSDAAKAQAMYSSSVVGYSNGSGQQAPMSPSLAYSSSRSTHSSGNGPRTPSEGLSERFTTLSTTTLRPSIVSKASLGSRPQSPPWVHPQLSPQVGSPKNFGGLPIPGEEADTDAADALSIRRPSSHTLALEDSDLLSGRDSPPPRNPARGPLVQDLNRVSIALSEPQGSTGSSADALKVLNSNGSDARIQSSIEHDDSINGKQINYGVLYDKHHAEVDRSPASYSNRAHETNHSTLEHIKYLQQHSRPPRHGINLFPSPPSSSPPRQGLPQIPPQQFPNPPPQSLPKLPVIQARGTSLNRAQTSPPDTLSLFPRPRPSPPHFQPPLSRLNAHGAASAPNPAHQSYSSLQQPPTDSGIPSIRADGSAPQIYAPGVHHLSHTSSIRSHASGTSSNGAPGSHHGVPLPLARPATAVSSAPSNAPLNLPTEKSTLGFCKCATRLFLSPNSDPKQSKSLSIANRPVGFNSMIPYWKCQKCNFEGPLSTVVTVADETDKKRKKGKEEKILDHKVRVSIGGGVRYRWVSQISSRNL